MQHRDGCLERYGIDAARVVYVGQKKGKTRSYVAESTSLLFFKKYDVPHGAVVLSDHGGSFFEHGKSVLVELGFQKHVCYPAEVHHYLSPNDNRLHGTAKHTWRS